MSDSFLGCKKPAHAPAAAAGAVCDTGAPLPPPAREGHMSMERNETWKSTGRSFIH